jgi:hypothetical protein
VNYLEWADFPGIYRLPESGGEFLKERQLGSARLQRRPTSPAPRIALSCFWEFVSADSLGDPIPKDSVAIPSKHASPTRKPLINIFATLARTSPAAERSMASAKSLSIQDIEMAATRKDVRTCQLEQRNAISPLP